MLLLSVQFNWTVDGQIYWGCPITPTREYRHRHGRRIRTLIIELGRTVQHPFEQLLTAPTKAGKVMSGSCEFSLEADSIHLFALAIYPIAEPENRWSSGAIKSRFGYGQPFKRRKTTTTKKKKYQKWEGAF